MIEMKVTPDRIKAHKIVTRAIRTQVATVQVYQDIRVQCHFCCKVSTRSSEDLGEETLMLGIPGRYVEGDHSHCSCQMGKLFFPEGGDFPPMTGMLGVRTRLSPEQHQELMDMLDEWRDAHRAIFRSNKYKRLLAAALAEKNAITV